MEISGKIIAVLPPQGGVSKAGRQWKKQEYVLETHDNFPKKVKFDFFGDRVDQYPLAIGDEVTVSFDIESREFNGRWYTDIHGWRADKGVNPAGATSFGQPDQSAQGGFPAQGGFAPAPAPQPTDFGATAGFGDPLAGGAANEKDDLPF